jgi:hypothetical protein
MSLSRPSPSAVTSKPANGGQGKTGLMEIARNKIFLSCVGLVRQVGFRFPAARPIFEETTVVQQAVKHGGDNS